MFPISSRIPWMALTKPNRRLLSSIKCSFLPFTIPETNFGIGLSRTFSLCQSFKTQKPKNDPSDQNFPNIENKRDSMVSEHKLATKVKGIEKRKGHIDDLSDWMPIYHCPYVVSARLLQRFKIGQTIFTVLITAPLCVSAFVFEVVEVESVYFAIGGSAFASVMLYVVGNFFSRFIGYIYISKTENPVKTVRIARLDFWGGRVDEYIPIEDIVPFSEYVENFNTAYIKVKQYTDEDDDKPFNLTLRYGKILEEEAFQQVFGGSSS